MGLKYVKISLRSKSSSGGQSIIKNVAIAGTTSYAQRAGEADYAILANRSEYANIASESAYATVAGYAQDVGDLPMSKITGLVETVNGFKNFNEALNDLLYPCDIDGERLSWKEATQADGNGGIKAKSLRSVLGIWTDEFISIGKKNAGASGSAGGASTLVQLEDVEITGIPTDGQVLAYDSTKHMWVNRAMASGLDTTQLAQYLTNNNYAKKSDLNGYATEDWVNDKGYITNAVLAGYATQKWVNDQGFAYDVNLAQHINDAEIHITNTERALWNQTATNLSSILGSDADNVINKWDEIVAFLDTYTEADTLAKLLLNKADKTQLGNYYTKTESDIFYHHSQIDTLLDGIPSNVVTFDNQKITGFLDESWINGFVSTHNNYLSSIIANIHRTNNWLVGWVDSHVPTPVVSWELLLHTGNYADTLDDRYVTKATYNSFKALFDSMFEKITENGVTSIKAKFGLWTDEFISIGKKNDGATGGGSGSGASFGRLDSWGNYDASKGDALSAVLGYGLRTDIASLQAHVAMLESGSALSVTETGSGNAVTDINKIGNAIVATKGATFLTQHQSLDYINVKDIRNTAPLPNELPGFKISAWFNNSYKPGNSYWYSGLTVHGWNSGNYVGWQLAGCSSESTDDKNLYFRVGIKSVWETWQKVLTDANYTSVLDSRYALVSALGNYLPLTGGIVSGVNDSPLIIDSTHNIQNVIVIRYKGVAKGQVGYNTTQGTILYNYASQKYLGITDAGVPHFNGNTLIHSGNISSYAITQHQSLANYVDKTSVQEISGAKTFSKVGIGVNSALIVGGTKSNIAEPVTTGYTSMLQIVAGAGGATAGSCIGFHNPSISSASLGYKNTDANNGIFEFKSDDPNWYVLAKKFAISGGTATQVLMANGSVRTLHVPTAPSDLGWGGTRGQIPTIDTLAFWNGAYVGTASNLIYCNKGAFGDIVTHAYSEFVTALGTNGNSLTWTKNGSINNITVPFASTSRFLEEATGLARGVNDSSIELPKDIPAGIRVRFKNSTGANSTAYWNTIVDLTAYSGTSASGAGYRNQFLFMNSENISNGSFWVRNGVDSTWNDWQKVLTEGNYTSVVTTLRDRTNGTATYLNYGASGISNPSWFAAWNGYELRAISPANVLSCINALSRDGGSMTNTNLVTNLNADLLDGYHESEFFRRSLGTVDESNILTQLPGNRSGSYTIFHSGWAGSAVVFHQNTSNSGLAFYRPGGSNSIPKILVALDSKSQWTDKGTILTTLEGNAVSATNADMLDGLHYTDFGRAYIGTQWNNNETVAQWALRRQYGLGFISTNEWAWANSANLKLNDSVSLDIMRYAALSVRNGNMSKWTYQQNAFLFIPTYNDSSMIYLAQMCTYDKAGTVSTWIKRYADYDTILNSNVASASRLATTASYTAWGQTFFTNGVPQSVDGVFRELIGGLLNGGVAHSILNNSGAPYGLITRIYGDGAVSLQAQRESTSSEWFKLILNPLGGNVGVSTLSPSYKLDVNGNTRVGTDLIVGGNASFGTTTVLNDSVLLRKHLVLSNANFFFTRSNDGSGEGMYFTPEVTLDNKKYMGLFRHINRAWVSDAFRFYFDGTFYAMTGIYTNGFISCREIGTDSDARLKNITGDLKLDIRDIANAPCVEFIWKDNGMVDIGSIAQHFQAINPLFTPLSPKGTLTMDYGKPALLYLIPTAKMVLSHEDKIKLLESKVKNLENENKELKNKISQLNIN